MGQVQPHPPVLLIVAAFSRHDEALAWGAEQAQRAWGPIALRSEAFAFDQTDYYTPSMGSGLRKEFWVFQRPFDPADLPDVKRTTSDWEADYAALARHPESRPLNLDPGYLTPAKLVLASTKDHAHRVYLRDGIYAEVTLYYQGGAWRAREWTFPDYRRADYQHFLSQARDFLMHRRRDGE